MGEDLMQKIKIQFKENRTEMYFKKNILVLFFAYQYIFITFTGVTKLSHKTY